VINKNTADVIVIGSGVAGLSVAMEFRKRGLSVRVFERQFLASGATSRAAGLIGQMRSNADAIRLIQDSLRIIREVEARTGMRILHETGSVRIAQTPDRAKELEIDIAIARASGLKVDTIDTHALEQRMPYMRVDDVLLASLCPTDCYLEPPALAQGYIAVGRELGVEYHEHEPVNALCVDAGQVTGVTTANATYNAPIVINAGGPWAELVAHYAEQTLPTAGIKHFYFTTLPESGIAIDENSPSLRDRENRIYARPRNGCLRVGIYEAMPINVDMRALPADFSMQSVTAGLDHPTSRALLDSAVRRFPGITPATPMDIRGGIMAFTPDGAPLIGEIPGLSGFYHCAGFCGHGVSQSAAMGPAMADIILHGTCPYDVALIAADRFADWPDLHDRHAVARNCAQVYANYYGKAATQ